MPISKALQHAQNLHQQGKLQDALREYLEIYTENPKDVSVAQFISLLYVQQGALNEALAFVKKAIKITPDASLYNSLGNILARQKKTKEAIRAYQKALQLEENYPGALCNLGNVYFTLQDKTAAEKCYQTALAIDSDYPDAHFNLARLFVEQKKTEEAITHLQRVLTVIPQHAAALGQLGVLYLDAGDYEKARELLEKRCILQPNSAPGLYMLGGLYLKLGKGAAAIPVFEKALELDAQLPEIHYQLATAYLLDKNPDKALSHYLRELERGEHLESLYNCGVILSDKQRVKDALHYFTRALALDPNHIATHLNMASLYLGQNQLSEAISQYQTALTLEPHNLEVQHILHALQQDETPTAAPTQYLQNLFDQYAPHYDKHLQEQLQYRAPHELFDRLMTLLYPEKKSLRIVDLGCGTGLTGQLFAPYAKEMVGVDISAVMLEQAKSKAIYQQLLQETLDDALAHLRDFDVILAADVLPYVGDLQTVFHGVFHALKSPGYFAFTVEKNVGPAPYVLQKTIRYAHHENHIKSSALAAGLQIHDLFNIILRYQQHTPLEGYLYILKKP